MIGLASCRAFTLHVHKISFSLYTERTLPRRRNFDRDIAQRIASQLAGAPGSLGNDALELLAGCAKGEALSAKQWETVGNYLSSLTIESYATSEDSVELCPRCGRVLVRERGDYWICSGALYETEAITEESSNSERPLSDRIWPLTEQPEEVLQMWRDQCGGSRTHLPSAAPKRNDFLSLIPCQLPWPLTFDELVARMAALYGEASLSLLNSTVRPKHLRAALDELRKRGVVSVSVGADGVARFHLVRSP